MIKSSKKREAIPGMKWHQILKWMRLHAQPCKISQETLAERMGYSEGGKSTITLIERGISLPNEKQIRSWVAVCGYEIETFYTLALHEEHPEISPK